MKYTFEFKLDKVLKYIDTHQIDYPSCYVTHSQKCTFYNHVVFWVAQYRAHGKEGLEHGLNRFFTPEEKLAYITPIMKGEISITQQSLATSIQASSLMQWMTKYRKYGIDGLKCSRRGRPRKNMSKADKIETKEEEVIKSSGDVEDEESLRKRIKDLEHQNLLLRVENEYIKKLSALVEQEKLATSKKRKSSRKSAKAKK